MTPQIPGVLFFLIVSINSSSNSAQHSVLLATGQVYHHREVFVTIESLSHLLCALSCAYAHGMCECTHAICACAYAMYVCSHAMCAYAHAMCACAHAMCACVHSPCACSHTPCSCTNVGEACACPSLSCSLSTHSRAQAWSVGRDRKRYVGTSS